MPKRLLRVTHRQQQYPADCLAACAAMALQYLGQPIDYGRLIRLLRIDLTIGTPFRHLALLDTLGVKVKLLQGTLADLNNWLDQERTADRIFRHTRIAVLGRRYFPRSGIDRPRQSPSLSRRSGL